MVAAPLSDGWRHGVVPAAAVAAFTLRLPWLALPPSADEAGFTLVARAWTPTADSLYGPYFVDRPPPLIAVFGATDLVGFPWALRLLGALAAAATVVLVARAARLIATPSAARWSAVLVAALLVTPLVDAVAVKGELLALPLLALSVWAALAAVRGRPRHPEVVAAVAGAAGVLAMGAKQNLVDGLVFGVVLIVSSRLSGEVTTDRFLRLAAGLVAGAAVPVLAMVAWARGAGVRLDTLWYALYGFRADAGIVLASGETGAAYQRLAVLLLVALAAGVAAVVAGFVLHLRREWHADPPVTAAVLAMLAVEVVGLVAGGSYWRDYLFPFVPSTGLAVALLARRWDRVGLRARTVIVVAVATSVVSIAVFAGLAADGRHSGEAPEDVGVAVARAAHAGDTLVVFGGQANIQIAAGLDSPYRHLWSLPMRTLDPEYDDLVDTLGGPAAPTWLVRGLPFGSWDAAGAPRLRRVIAQRYVVHGECHDTSVYLRRGLVRRALDCA